MKEEALKLADEIDNFLKEEEQLPWGTKQVYLDMASTMIRRLVGELNKYKMAWNMAENELEKTKQELDCALDYIKQYQLERKPTITKLDGKVVAVTMTDDEHRVIEVLWEAPKPLSDEEILDIWYDFNDGSHNWTEYIKFARAIEERHGIK